MKKLKIILVTCLMVSATSALAATDPCTTFGGNWSGSTTIHEYVNGSYIGDCIYNLTSQNNVYQSVVSMNMGFTGGHSPQGIHCHSGTTTFTGTCSSAQLNVSGAWGNASGVIINNQITLNGKAPTGATYSISLSK